MDATKQAFWEHMSEIMGIDDGKPTKHLNIKDFAAHVEKVVGETEHVGTVAVGRDRLGPHTPFERDVLTRLDDISSHMMLMETVQLQKVRHIDEWLQAIDKSLLGIVEALQMIGEKLDD